METVSEKKKRGRPRSLSSEHLVALRRIFPENQTARSLQDVHFRIRACGLIEKASKAGATWTGWLFDPEEAATARKSYRRTILTALGRIKDDDDLLATAKKICELKPTAREARKMITRARLGKSKHGSAVQLACRLIDTINDYLQTCPDTTEQQILGALDNVKHVVEEGPG